MLVTQAGLQRLVAQLDDLDHTRRAEVAERLRAARDFGDGLENLELLNAKEEAWLLERQICEVRALLSSSEVAESGHRRRGEVSIGSRVSLTSEFGKQEFQIVGSVEADPLARRISDRSPLGSALIGRHSGDRIEWDSPGGRLSAVVNRVA